MLSGRPPFGGRSNKEIIDSVLKGSYSFSNPVWNDISKEAKDLISKLLERQADMRLTSEEAYNHPWIQRQKNKEFGEIHVDKQVFSNMESYMNSVQLKRTTLSYMASRIPEDQIILLRQNFTKIDKNGDGQLTIEELVDGLRDCKEIKIDLSDLKRAM